MPVRTRRLRGGSWGPGFRCQAPGERRSPTRRRIHVHEKCCDEQRQRDGDRAPRGPSSHARKAGATNVVVIAGPTESPTSHEASTHAVMVETLPGVGGSGDSPGPDETHLPLRRDNPPVVGDRAPIAPRTG